MNGINFKKLSSLFLAVCIIVLQFAICVRAEITYPCYAKIKQANGKGYTIAYTKPGTTGHEAAGEEKNSSQPININIYDNEIIRVLGVGIDGDGDTWYKAQYGEGFSKEGYVFSSHVIFIGNYVTDPAFEESIKNFPESYKVKLRNLHAIYPNWKFNADYVGRSWEEVIAAESVPGKKLVSHTKPDSWKSNDPATKDENGNWKWYDSGGWVAASKMVIEYYMDPRNMLETGTVFMFAHHNYDANYDTADKLAKILSGTFMEGTLQDDASKTYLDVIMSAGKTYGVSPLVMAAKFIQEQGTGGSNNVSGNYSGYENLYNFFNIGAFTTPDFPTATQRGLWWAAGEGKGNKSYGRPWNTREKSIHGGAQWYAAEYLSGYQNTFYYMNFDVKGNYSHQYATNIQDGAQKATGLAKGFSGLSDLEMVFTIPIYDNMPEYTTLPTETSNNNNYLKVLEVEGYNLGFDQTSSQHEYELMVNYRQSSVNIIAIPDYADAIVTGAGVRQLAVGHNEIPITVRATSGELRTYKIHIHRRDNSDGDIPIPTLNTSYKIGDYLTGVAFETDLNTFIANLGVSNGRARVYDSSDNEKASGIVATGDTVRVYDAANVVINTYKVVILGDCSGDGKINSRDLLIGQRHILKIEQLSGAYAVAIDIDKDGTVKSRDLLMGQRHILRLESIIQ